jgi:hypothetical protein
MGGMGGFSSSMSFTSSTGTGGVSVSQQTIVENGRRVTRTVRRFADGRTETAERVEHASGGDWERLPSGGGARSWQRAGSNFLNGETPLVHAARVTAACDVSWAAVPVPCALLVDEQVAAAGKGVGCEEGSDTRVTAAWGE